MTRDITFTQLSYIVALDDEKNFQRAADNNFVSQPALTMQVKKLEDNLGILLFDRTRKPLVTTEIGIKIVKQARFVLQEVKKIEELIEKFKEEMAGEVKIGIIPTVAPYLTPFFVHSFVAKYPKIKIEIVEAMTDDILVGLNRGEFDMGVIVTPYLKSEEFLQFPLYYEKFYAFIAPLHYLHGDDRIDLKRLDVDELWLLTEGNCFRNQVLNICQQDQSPPDAAFKYSSTSLESLKRIVTMENGLTILPELSLNKADKVFMSNVREFNPGPPYREVSLIVTRAFLKQNLIEKLRDEIISTVPPEMVSSPGSVVSID